MLFYRRAQMTGRATELDWYNKMILLLVMLFKQPARRSIFIFLTLFFLFIGHLMATEKVMAAEKDFEKERRIYKETRDHLRKERWRQYLNHKQQLRDYPLFAYLEYEEILKEDAARRSAPRLRSFIETYPYFPYLARVRKILAEELYRRENWQEVLSQTHPDFIPCLHLAAAAKLKQSNREELRERALQIWNNGKELDGRCVKILRENGFDFYSDPSLVWQRVIRALENRKSGLARSLRHYLSSSQKTTLDMLLRIRHNTRQIKRYASALKNLPHHCDLITYALTHYPDEHVAEGYKDYKTYARKCNLSPLQHTQIRYYLGLHLTLNGESDGLAVMLSLDPQFLSDDEQHEWRARSAIKFSDWKNLLKITDSFPPELAQESAWLFWKGYALSKLRKQQEAVTYYDLASDSRDFYGFLAAEIRGKNKKIEHRPANTQIGAGIMQTLPFLRFMEFVYLGQRGNAYKEWSNMLDHASKNQILALAGFAHEQRNYYLAIRAFSEAEYWDDLQRRYPLPYFSLVKNTARANNLNPALLYAIMRTESSYRPEVRSGAGAVGLLQVLPSTAREVKRRYNYAPPLRLVNPKVSIDIGGLYLRQLFDTYQGHLVLTIASYNAGPTAVKSWLPERGSKPAIEWIETIPYGETRKYVRRVLYSWVIFEWRLGKAETVSLRHSMRDINYRYR